MADDDGLIVVNVGLFRTGNYSIRAALYEILGGPCYDVNDLLLHRSHASLWLEAFDGNITHEDWRKLLKGYKTSVDAPGFFFYKELMEVFPKCKFILSTRELESWYQSAMSAAAVVVEFPFKFPYSFCFNLLTNKKKVVTMADKGAERLFGKGFDWKRVHLDLPLKKEILLSGHRRHVESVKATIPPERLLVFDVKEGWEPLCKFLNRPVPEKPFPHANNKRIFQMQYNALKLLCYFIVFGIPVVVLIILQLIL